MIYLLQKFLSHHDSQPYGENVSITAKIKNNGNQSAQNFITEFYIDTDSNNVVDLLLSSVTSSNLSSGDSISITSTSQIHSLQKKVLTCC